MILMFFVKVSHIYHSVTLEIEVPLNSSEYCPILPGASEGRCHTSSACRLFSSSRQVGASSGRPVMIRSTDLPTDQKSGKRMIVSSVPLRAVVV